MFCWASVFFNLTPEHVRTTLRVAVCSLRAACVCVWVRCSCKSRRRKGVDAIYPFRPPSAGKETEGERERKWGSIGISRRHLRAPLTDSMHIQCICAMLKCSAIDDGYRQRRFSSSRYFFFLLALGVAWTWAHQLAHVAKGSDTASSVVVINLQK